MSPAKPSPDAVPDPATAVGDAAPAVMLPVEGPPPSVAGRVATLLLLAGVVAVAVVEDEQILRTKLVTARALVLGAACVGLLAQALAGRLRVPWSTWLFAALVPAGLALLHPLHTPVASRAVAWDEAQRLLLVPAAAWATGSLLAGARARAGFLAALSIGAIVVGGLAMLQRLGALHPVASRWMVELELTHSARVMAGFGNPVFLGSWLVLTTPLLLAEALTGRTALRWLAGLGAGLALPALLATDSTGAWAGFALAAVVGVGLLLETSRQRRRYALAVGAVALLALGVLLTGRELLAALELDGVFRSRVHTLIWRDTWQLFLDQPGGVGPGQFQVAFLPYASAELLAEHPMGAVIINDAHSEPLQLLVELGWPAVVAVAAAVLCAALAVRAMLAAPWRDLHARALFAAGAGSLAGAVGESFVSPDLRFHVTALSLGVLVGFLASQAPATVVRVRGGAAGRGLVALVAVAALGLVGWSTFQRLSLAARLEPPAPTTREAPGEEEFAALEAAVAAAPGDPAAWYALGAAHYEALEHAHAAEAFRRALELDPSNGVLLRSLGICQALSGQYADANTTLRRSLLQRPDDPEVRYLVAFVAFARGDLRTALMEAERLVEEYPDHVRAIALLERLRE